MYIEIDSTDIIAFILRESNYCDDVEIPFEKIVSLATTIESEHKDILTSCDCISIDAFRCAFSSNVKVEHSVVKVYKANSIRGNIERLLPSERIINLLEEISHR